MLLTLACLALGGLLLGGAWSLRSQGSPAGAVAAAAALGLLAVAAGVLRMAGGWLA